MQQEAHRLHQRVSSLRSRIIARVCARGRTYFTRVKYAALISTVSLVHLSIPRSLARVTIPHPSMRYRTRAFCMPFYGHRLARAKVVRAYVRALRFSRYRESRTSRWLSFGSLLIQLSNLFPLFSDQRARARDVAVTRLTIEKLIYYNAILPHLEFRAVNIDVDIKRTSVSVIMSLNSTYFTFTLTWFPSMASR